MNADLYPTDYPVALGESRSKGAVAALTEGTRRVLVRWPALLFMLLGTLVAAGLLALIPALNLFSVAHTALIDELAAGVRAGQLVDLVQRIAESQTNPSDSPFNGPVALVLLGFALMPLVGGVVSAFLYGGVLLSYKEAGPSQAQGFRLGRFLWGCGRWFLSFLALGIIQAVLFLLLFVPLVFLAVFLGRFGTVGIAAGAALVVLFALLGLMVFELARVRLVLNDSRNLFRALGQAFVDLFRRPLTLLGFYAAALLLLLGVQALFRLVINPNAPLDVLPLALLVQQGFLLVRLFCRALRLAGLMSLFQ